MQKKCGNCAFLEKNLARIATERPDERSEGGFAVRAGLTRKCAPNFQKFYPVFCSILRNKFRPIIKIINDKIAIIVIEFTAQKYYNAF